MELINTHCHSKYCGHGEGDVADYAAIAADAGLTTLAFTEHFPLSPAFDPDEYLSVLPENMPAYRQAVERARDEHPQMEILLGIEMDYLGDTEDRAIASDDLASFEIILGSVHFVDRWPFDDPAQRDRWEEPGMVDAIWRRYVDLWCEAASDPSQPFTVMSHPDLAKKFAYYPSFDLTPLYARMAEAAAAGGRMIEVNTSGGYYACKEMFPAPALLEQFARAQVPCTVGTDAHEPRLVTRDIERGYDLMRRAGYKCVTVPTRERGRRTIDLM